MLQWEVGDHFWLLRPVGGDLATDGVHPFVFPPDPRGDFPLTDFVDGGDLVREKFNNDGM